MSLRTVIPRFVASQLGTHPSLGLQTMAGRLIVKPLTARSAA